MTQFRTMRRTNRFLDAPVEAQRPEALEARSADFGPRAAWLAQVVRDIGFDRDGGLRRDVWDPFDRVAIDSAEDRRRARLPDPNPRQSRRRTSGGPPAGGPHEAAGGP